MDIVNTIIDNLHLRIPGVYWFLVSKQASFHKLSANSKSTSYLTLKSHLMKHFALWYI